MTKTHKLPKNIFFAFFATIMLAISCLLASCGGPSVPPATMYNVTWEVSDKATVAVEGYETLPTQVEEDTSLVFTVTAAENYEISSVKSNSKKVTASKGKYTVKVTKDTSISVETGRVITGIEVSKNPTKLTYFAGDALDVAGMEVKVKYATGESEVITKGADGYSVSPSIFEGGETSFKVIYDDFEAIVNLDGRVEYLVTIDPAGGTIVSKWMSDLEALGLSNYSVAANGVITFSYFNNLPHDIQLPVESQITREDFSFQGWSNAAAITNTSGTFSTTAKWQAELVVIHSAELKVENEHPYLIVEGQYKVANEVYLYLYEGNAKISLTGDTYTNTTGVNGAEFEVKFDLLKLAHGVTEDGGSFEGAWMDIRFNAKFGDRVESMELFVGEGSQIEVDLTQRIEAEGYAFLFATYANMLKVYYNTVHYSYSVAQEGNNIAIIGAAKLYKGATILVTAWAGSSEVELGSATIDATTGEFKVLIDIDSIVQETNNYCHVTISNADGEALHGSTGTNLAIAACSNIADMVKLDKKKGDVVNAIKMTSESGVAAYVGYQWDGLIIFAQNEAQTITYELAAIEYVEGEVYYVVSGMTKGYTLAELEFEMDLQHNANIDGAGWGYEFDTNDSDVTFRVELEANGAYKCYVPVSQIMGGLWDPANTIWAFTVHFGIAGARKDFKPDAISTDYAVKDGVKYSIRQDGSTWSIAALVMETTDEADGMVATPKIAVTNIAIGEVSGKAVITISGTYANVEAAALEADYRVDFQQNPYAATGGWDGTWDVLRPEATLVAENGVWTLSIDVTDMEAWAYTSHICLLCATAHAEDGTGHDFPVSGTLDESVTVGSKTYTLSNSDAFWGNLGLIVAEAQ